MIVPVYDAKLCTVFRPTESERSLGQALRGEIRVGPDAAREIARRIESQGGFWGERCEVAAQ